MHGVPRHEASGKRGAPRADGSGARARCRAVSGKEAQRVAVRTWPSTALLLMDDRQPHRRNAVNWVKRRMVSGGWAKTAATRRDFVRDYADRVIVMAGGQVVEEGTPAAVLGSPQHPATRMLLSQKKQPSGGGGE
jgi:ABC-type polar amino acid transport system ATPase subunit